MIKCGLNGNIHPEHIFDLEGALEKMGVSYVGEGCWNLPDGATIESAGGDDWCLTLGDESEWYVWVEDTQRKWEDDEEVWLCENKEWDGECNGCPYEDGECPCD